jgi:hypothetical protein
MEQQAEYITDAKEMTGKGYEHRVQDESNDHKYFVITPRIVKAFSRSPYDLSLWDTIRDVAGERGECYLTTNDLAILSDMSSGKVSDSRAYWLSIGFLKGEMRQDPGYPQPVWHLSIPDLWEKNIKWCEENPKISDRLAHKESLHHMKPSPGEKGYPPHEKGYSPHETKKSIKKSKKEGNIAASPRAPKPPEIVLYRETTRLFPSEEVFDQVIEHIGKVRVRLGREVVKDDLLPFRAAWVSKGYNRFAITWLEWAVDGAIPPNGTWKSRVAEPAAFGAIRQFEEMQNG